MNTKILEDLGLTNAEIKVYLALLRLGTSNATPILERTDIQSSVVFRALNSLIKKGLIHYNLEGRRKNYQATDPEQFFEFIDEKRKRFETILPELKKEQLHAKNTEKATVYKGLRGLKEVYRIMRETKGKEYNSFGGGKPCEDLLGADWWMNHHGKRVARKLPSRQIFDGTVKKAGQKQNTLPLTEIRFVDKKFEQLQETVIVGDKVAICVFTESPYAFLMHDNVVADGYRKQFEFMWKSAHSLQPNSH